MKIKRIGNILNGGDVEMHELPMDPMTAGTHEQVAPWPTFLAKPDWPTVDGKPVSPGIANLAGYVAAARHDMLLSQMHETVRQAMVQYRMELDARAFATKGAMRWYAIGPELSWHD